MGSFAKITIVITRISSLKLLALVACKCFALDEVRQLRDI